MSSERYLLAIDQGTTSSRAIAFDVNGQIQTAAQQEFPQHFPENGWVEHDPEDIWNTTLEVSRAVLGEIEADGPFTAAIGITNQRETTVVWVRDSGEAVYPAIVWQDRRTAPVCRGLVADGMEPEVTARTGLVIDSYFSATKIAWILDNVADARRRAERGELAFGTVDSFLVWRLTGGNHVTDATNASRTSLFNIHTQSWDPELLRMFDVPETVLPDVLDSSAPFGQTDAKWFGRAIPICGIAGDQQAAAIGQACFSPGTVKSTYGTGCFVMLNTGDAPVDSNNRLLTTVAYRFDGRPTYALEGSIFISGAAVQWLRDGLRLIERADETESLARSLSSNRGVYLVPAFTGLGAPHWDPEARGAILGLTRDTGIAEIARAALEAVCYQTHDLVVAMQRDGAVLNELRVDGGMVGNTWMLQFLADVLDLPVDRPVVQETTALGAAFLAGLGVGLYDSLEDVAGHRETGQRFQPSMPAAERGDVLAGWARALDKVRTTTA